MAQLACNYFTYPTAHGPITICATDSGILEIAFSDKQLGGARKASELTNAAATQIQEYLAGKRFAFDVPLAMGGSAFQQAVWTEVGAIPYGEVRTAADVAEAIGKPGAHRSVGTAIRRNSLPILIPTHRVDLPNATGRTAKIFGALRSLEARASARQAP